MSQWLGKSTKSALIRHSDLALQARGDVVMHGATCSAVNGLTDVLEREQAGRQRSGKHSVRSALVRFRCQCACNKLRRCRGHDCSASWHRC